MEDVEGNDEIYSEGEHEIRLEENKNGSFFSRIIEVIDKGRKTFSKGVSNYKRQKKLDEIKKQRRTPPPSKK